MQKRFGFTVIELLIVVLVIALLFILANSKFEFAGDKVKNNSVSAELLQYKVGIDQTVKNDGLQYINDEPRFVEELNKYLDPKTTFDTATLESKNINPYGSHYTISVTSDYILIYSPESSDTFELSSFEVYAATDTEKGEKLIYYVASGAYEIKKYEGADDLHTVDLSGNTGSGAGNGSTPTGGTTGNGGNTGNTGGNTETSSGGAVDTTSDGAVDVSDGEVIIDDEPIPGGEVDLPSEGAIDIDLAAYKVYSVEETAEYRDINLGGKYKSAYKALLNWTYFVVEDNQSTDYTRIGGNEVNRYSDKLVTTYKPKLNKFGYLDYYMTNFTVKYVKDKHKNKWHVELTGTEHIFESAKYVRGSYIKTIKAEYKAYPDNGKQGDFWYERVELRD